VHDDFMERLQRHLDHEEGTLCSRQMLLCQALLKCADISNPSRPYVVSQHWATALMDEWAKQAIYEKSLAFKPSVQESTSPLKEAKSQVSFIGRFGRPLLELTAQAIPEMERYFQECVQNNDHWTARVKELEARPYSGNDDETIPTQTADDYVNVFPLTLPHSRQATGDDVHPSPSDSGLVSPCGSDNNFFKLEEHAAIRAAGKMGSRQQKIFNRNSWCATSPNPLSGTQPAPSPLAHVQEASGSPPSDVA